MKEDNNAVLRQLLINPIMKQFKIDLEDALEMIESAEVFHSTLGNQFIVCVASEYDTHIFKLVDGKLEFSEFVDWE
tara:strand:- start:28597 stop:28824 length:228 start_codon:yes stop_codon:yes gene_type:complete